MQAGKTSSSPPVAAGGFFHTEKTKLMTVLRRFLVMMALLFWQGGFLFYAAVVVPEAQKELTHLRQGFVTRRVTNDLNLSGAIAVAVLALDLAVRDHKPRRRFVRGLLWLGLAITLAYLAWLHTRLDSLLDPDKLGLVDATAFRSGHRLYLWISAIQWVFGLAFLWLTLDAWRAADGQTSPVISDNGQKR
jgi:hypothetical protein